MAIWAVRTVCFRWSPKAVRSTTSTLQWEPAAGQLGTISSAMERGPQAPSRGRFPTQETYTSQKKLNLQALPRDSSWKTRLMCLHPSALTLLPAAVLLLKRHTVTHTHPRWQHVQKEAKQPFGCSPTWELGCSYRAKSHLKLRKQSHCNAENWI